MRLNITWEKIKFNKIFEKGIYKNHIIKNIFSDFFSLLFCFFINFANSLTRLLEQRIDIKESSS